MKVSFVAGFGPIVRDVDASRTFWGAGLGIALAEAAPNYWTNDHLDGVKAFGLWPLAQAAESCFGTPTWPADIPAPQAWVEFDVESPAAVAEAVAELAGAGHRLLRGAHEEPRGSDHLPSTEPGGVAHWGYLHALDAPHCKR